MTAIPFADPRRGLLAVREELLAACARVIDSGRYILGEEVLAFERDWSARCATTDAIGVSSGTDALALALRAAGVQPRDEVLVPAMTAIATWMAVAQIGAVPVGVDIDAATGSIDPAAAAARRGAATRAVVAVHLFGHPADIAGLQRLGLTVIEDAAQAHGAVLDGRPVGGLATAGAFSFYPTKNLGAVGDAGAVTTSDPELADRVRLLREYGWRTRADSELTGVNARLDELQAALLRVLLGRLDAALERRQAIASAYRAGLADVAELELVTPRLGSTSAWHLFVVRHPRRDQLAAALAQRDIATAVHYTPAPAQTTSLRRSGERFPVAERHAATALSLPLFPELADADVERVVGAVREACASL